MNSYADNREWTGSFKIVELSIVSSYLFPSFRFKPSIVGCICD